VKVLVTVPYWRTPDTIRRCVDSILAQSHEDLVCLVVNDRDRRTPPWPELVDIQDPRLVRFDSRTNRGRYFHDAAAAQMAADRFEWWMPVDADDWLEPGRVRALVNAASPDVDAVMSGWTQHHEDGTVVRRPLRPPGPGRPRAVAHLSSLWRPEFARALAHPAQRVGWDQVQTTAAWTFGRVAAVDDWQYHRQLRQGSLTRNPVNGKGTKARRVARRHQRVLWERMRVQPDLPTAAAVLAEDVGGLAAEVDVYATRLRAALDAA
jgi:glycosyltransferase involved in cell wall biosynthesis